MSARNVVVYGWTGRNWKNCWSLTANRANGPVSAEGNVIAATGTTIAIMAAGVLIAMTMTKIAGAGAAGRIYSTYSTEG